MPLALNVSENLNRSVIHVPLETFYSNKPVNKIVLMDISLIQPITHALNAIKIVNLVLEMKKIVLDVLLTTFN